jgi:hypothetical protein
MGISVVHLMLTYVMSGLGTPLTTRGCLFLNASRFTVIFFSKFIFLVGLSHLRLVSYTSTQDPNNFRIPCNFVSIPEPVFCMGVQEFLDRRAVPDNLEESTGLGSGSDFDLVRS